jgi:hypothetical protein
MSGLWKVPDLWTRKRTRAHKVLGRRQTDAGAHTYHRPQRRHLRRHRQRPCAPRNRRRYSRPRSGWPPFKRSRMAGFQRSVTPQAIAELAEHVARICEELGLLNREPPPAIEIGNEPDIAYTYADRSDLFAEAVRLSRDRIRRVSEKIQVITGGVMTTGRGSIDYLAGAVRSGLPEDCIIGYHTYRTTRRPDDPLDGFPNRDAEFAALKGIAVGRPIWCTEAGWHTAPSTVRYGFLKLRKRRIQFTDAEVADFAEREVRINAAQGALGFVWFQLNDGPDPNEYEHRFGIRTIEGAWKPVADRLADLGPTVA